MVQIGSLLGETTFIGLSENPVWKPQGECVLVRVLQRTEQTEPIEISTYRFIMRSWLMRLWRLKSPRICCWQAGDPSKVSGVIQAMPEGLRTRGADDLNQSRRR